MVIIAFPKRGTLSPCVFEEHSRHLTRISDVCITGRKITVLGMGSCSCQITQGKKHSLQRGERNNKSMNFCFESTVVGMRQVVSCKGCMQSLGNDWQESNGLSYPFQRTVTETGE